MVLFNLAFEFSLNRSNFVECFGFGCVGGFVFCGFCMCVVWFFF